MSLVVTQAASLSLMDAMTVYLDTCTVGLFTNNFFPSATSVLGDFAEATFPGYSQQATNVWGAAFLNGLQKGESDHPALTWSPIGPSTDVVFGYFILDPSNVLVFAERFAGSGFPMFGSGNSLSVDLKFTDVSEF